VTKLAKDFDPQNADFEVLAQQVVAALNPNLEQIRGPSNDAGDDGLFRDTKTGQLTTVEAKHLRQQTALPQKHIINVDEAAARNEELYGAPSNRVIVTTSDSLTLGSKKKVKQIQRDGRNIEIVNYSELQRIAKDPSISPETVHRIEASLNKKARRTKGPVGAEADEDG